MYRLWDTSMLNALVSITFRVKAETALGEVVGVVGNCPELGNWLPQYAQTLNLVPELGKRDVWSRTIVMHPTLELKYRYFVGFVRESEHEGEQKTVIVTSWETNIMPRKFHILDLASDCAATEEAIYGHYDGRTNVSRGWLTSQTEVRLYLCDNPIKLWKLRHQERSIRIKCTTMDLRYKDMAMDDESNESEITTGCAVSRVQVAVLNGEHDTAKYQPQYGTVFNPNDFLIFKAQTSELEFLGYQFDLYSNARDETHATHLGTAYLLPNSLTDMSRKKTIPINSTKNKPIGQLTVSYQVIKPMAGFSCDMAVSYGNIWKRDRKTLHVGHRGMGISYAAKESPVMRENTIASLSEAVSHGADFVEFDVQLTRDNYPVVYHDYNVCLSIKKKESNEQEWFKIPVHKLNLEHLQSLKLENELEIDASREESSFDGAPINHQPFPTLQQCFEQLDPHIGFNIEIKYPMQMKSGEMEEGMVHFMERNEFVDHILKVILGHAEKRRIIIACFDPDVCTMVQLKQNKYPVMLLCQDDNNVYPPYNDVRSQKIKISFSYARFDQMLGVCPFTLPLLMTPSLIATGVDMGLIIFCWGEMNNDKKTIDKLKSLGVHGIIHDRISDFKLAKENVFKMESRAKLELLSQVSAMGPPNGFKAKPSSASSFLAAIKAQ